MNRSFPWTFDQGKPSLTDDLFASFAELIYRHTGIRFGPESKFVLERRLLHRMRALELPDLHRYYYHLLYHPEREAELEVLIDVVTTHETYFFREKNQLICLRDEIIPMLMERKARDGNLLLKIWSAGCSTGEEPYTVAMLIDEIPELQSPEWKVMIYASDISARALQAARDGVYGPSSFRDMEPRYLKKYFQPVGENRYRISEDIKKRIMFGKINILDTSRLVLFGRLDVILCRNVIIYFDLESKKRAIDNFYQRLCPGGFLLLGHSESLLGLDPRFHLEHLKNDMVYRK